LLPQQSELTLFKCSGSKYSQDRIADARTLSLCNLPKGMHSFLLSIRPRNDEMIGMKLTVNRHGMLVLYSLETQTATMVKVALAGTYY
jgi:hypothetical protein